ncbi:MAG TPA: phosphohistidine phosphatase SixA [Candidatus Acidoferrum sp.]|jgi:phosphohistidine phosphatase
MLLYVVRHGIAIAHDDPKCPSDPERYLTEEGIEKTRQVAKGVATLGTVPDLLLTSPYVRALQTAEIFARALDYPRAKIRQTDLLLPGSEASAFFRELAKNKQSAAILCFGHGPQVDDLVAAPLGAKQHVTALKKAGVAVLDLKKISPPSGELVWLATPKMLRAVGK